MKDPPAVRRVVTWTAVALCALTGALAGLLAIAATNVGRPLLIRIVERVAERRIKVDGGLRVELLSLHPRVIADRVTVGNPSWTTPGEALLADRVSLVLRLPGWHRSGGVTAIDVQGASLHLIRDAAGRANWQWRDPAKRKPNRNSAIVRSVSILNARVVLDDARRHLQFSGTVSARALGTPGDPQPLLIDGSGQLNGRPATFRITADSLATATHRTPYHFTFTERSGDSRLEGSGVLPEPFVVEVTDATFAATGPDLKDLYFLTGVHLIDTGTYHLSGKVERRGKLTTFSDLIATSGGSDMRGRVITDSSSGRPKFTVELHSGLLKLSDLGLRAAGRAPAARPPLLLSEAMISPNVLQVAGAVAKYHADKLEVGRLDLENVSLDAAISKDVLTVAPVAATVSGGRVSAHLTLDGNQAIPTASVAIRIVDAQLGQLLKKDAESASPLEGSMQASIQITGQGRSVHQVAATATGTVSAQMTGGAVRKSIAELTDVDLRGLGLVLSGDKQDVPVRCAVARFKAQQGTLTVQDLLADTDPVLITGEGEIHLDSESLNLAIRGTPKSRRWFRLRTPLLVQGTLAHPSIHIPIRHSHFMVADNNRAADTDCTAVLARGP